MNDEPSSRIHFPELQLDFIESRILGCLLEKQTTTPAYYPMTANSLEAAANQTSNRYPVTKFSAEEIAQGIQSLRKKEVIVQIHISGSRVPKYEHLLPDLLELSSAENAVMTVLLLRGVQTAGEIKQRSERLHPFTSVEQVEEVLEGFQEYPNGPLVKEIPAGGGRRVKTYAHLLGGETGLNVNRIGQSTNTEIPLTENDAPDWKAETEERLTDLENSMAVILKEIETLKAALSSESQ